MSPNLLNAWLSVGSKYLALGVLVVNKKEKNKKKGRKRKNHKKKIIIIWKPPSIHLKQGWKAIFKYFHWVAEVSYVLLYRSTLFSYIFSSKYFLPQCRLPFSLGWSFPLLLTSLLVCCSLTCLFLFLLPALRVSYSWNLCQDWSHDTFPLCFLLGVLQFQFLHLRR